MDELDLLKSHWQKDNIKEKQLSSKEIYPLLLKKSSSIVKTLFYISIAELLFWVLINALPMFMSEEYKNNLNELYGNDIMLSVIPFITYGVIIFFVYLLYKSYKSISVTDNAKKLMESILKTRKVIRYYVLYNLFMAGASSLFIFYLAFTNNPELMTKLNDTSLLKTLVMIGVIVVFTAVFILMFWGFYKLLYGILLKRLNKNYSELKKLEV